MVNGNLLEQLKTVQEIKMNFDIKDVKSWSNRYDVKIGDEGYFFHDIDKLRNFENEYIKPVKSKLSAIRDNYARCFQIDNGRDGDNVFEFFLPKDAVKENKTYRACRTVQELYELVFNYRSKDEDRFCINELIGTVIHFKQKGFDTTFYECITGIAVYNNGDIDVRMDGCTFTLPELFKNYKIEINGEWHPFGAVKNCTGE